ncbi:hypothetical protein CRUP_029744 [Coryphaenoides rupestris]|nr:hypothetical protein CRUP_029744 [Coryphaenoides rupestris]
MKIESVHLRCDNFFSGHHLLDALLLFSLNLRDHCRLRFRYTLLNGRRFHCGFRTEGSGLPGGPGTVTVDNGGRLEWNASDSDRHSCRDPRPNTGQAPNEPSESTKYRPQTQTQPQPETPLLSTCHASHQRVEQLWQL